MLSVPNPSPVFQTSAQHHSKRVRDELGLLVVVDADSEAGVSQLYEAADRGDWLGTLLPRLLTTPNGSQKLPAAPYDYKHTLLLASNESHCLPSTSTT